MARIGKLALAATASVGSLAFGVPAALAEQAQDWQIGLQPAATPVREHIDALNTELTVIIVVITAFVLALLAYVIIRFNAKRHPVPSQTSHNSVLELVWTAAPILILLAIAIPSFKLMYYMDRTPKPDMTLNITGHQWYWTYQYPDQGKLQFDSNVLTDDQDKKAGEPRMLGVDNPVVVPVGAVIRVLVTSTDVIHSWFMPALGVQEYAVIGRTNFAWMKLDRPGTFYGECNQICGLNHPFMPIEVKAVSKDDFAKWLAAAQKKFARDDRNVATPELRLAQQSAR
jgi:cytochrome c oxidase subunit 2